MRTPSLAALVTLLPFALLICPVVAAQDNSSAAPGLSQRSNISEVMEWLDKNGLAQARVGVRSSSRPVRKESEVLQEDAFPALSLFYSEGFKSIQIENCGMLLRNDNTQLLAHSKLAPDPPPDQRYRAELYISLNRLSLNKAKDRIVTLLIQTKLTCLAPGERSSKATGPRRTSCSLCLLLGSQNN